MKYLFVKLLPYIARLHYKNWANKSRWDYPQLWYCWPKFMTRNKSPKITQAKERVCGALTGHEISKTEWGYGGGKHADCHCRWCDYVIQIPIMESPPPNDFLSFYSQKLDPKNGSGLI